MILLTHIFIAAIIAAKIKYWPLALFFALLSHYSLDFLPHNEYLIKNIERKDWKNSEKDFLKIGIDFGIGIIL